VTWEGLNQRHEKALENFYQAFPQANDAVIITSENADEYI